MVASSLANCWGVSVEVVAAEVEPLELGVLEPPAFDAAELRPLPDWLLVDRDGVVADCDGVPVDRDGVVVDWDGVVVDRDGVVVDEPVEGVLALASAERRSASPVSAVARFLSSVATCCSAVLAVVRSRAQAALGAIGGAVSRRRRR